jgi:hypothetical protein
VSLPQEEQHYLQDGYRKAWDGRIELFNTQGHKASLPESNMMIGIQREEATVGTTYDEGGRLGVLSSVPLVFNKLLRIDIFGQSLFTWWVSSTVVIGSLISLQWLIERFEFYQRAREGNGLFTGRPHRYSTALLVFEALILQQVALKLQIAIEAGAMPSLNFNGWFPVFKQFVIMIELTQSFIMIQSTLLLSTWLPSWIMKRLGSLFTRVSLSARSSVYLTIHMMIPIVLTAVEALAPLVFHFKAFDVVHVAAYWGSSALSLAWHVYKWRQPPIDESKNDRDLRRQASRQEPPLFLRAA